MRPTQLSEMRGYSCVLVLLIKWRLVDAGCDVIENKEWDGVKPHLTEYMPRPVSLVIIQHTNTSWCSTSEQCKRSVRSIQVNTIDSQNFDDVGYSFVIGGDGKIYEGVGWLRVGSHTIGYDRTAFGIAFIGNYTDDTPTPQQLKALRGLLKCGAEQGHLTPDFRILCHRQLFLAESPGQKLFDEIRKCPQWLENIDKASEPRSLIITKHAIDLGLYDSMISRLNTTGLDNQIYDAVVAGDYNHAADLSIILDTFSEDNQLTDVVNKLLANRTRNTMEYAYKLWNYGGQNLIPKYFPIEFKIIFNKETFKIANNRDGLALKMSNDLDYDGDRYVWGDSKDKSSDRVIWKMTPLFEDNRVYFKLYNVAHNMYIKMGVKVDNIGDHYVYGSHDADTIRHQWYLHPMRYKNETLFVIYNRKYGQLLKLARDVDDIGDRLLWGNNAFSDDPELYGWRLFN